MPLPPLAYRVVPIHPISWGGDSDPVTILGGDFADAVITVTGTLPAPAGGRGGDNPAAVLLPCNATLPAQRWAFNSPASEYLSNGAGATQLCLNVDGCNTDLIYYACVTSGGWAGVGEAGRGVGGILALYNTLAANPSLGPRRDLLRRRLLCGSSVRDERLGTAVAPASEHLRLRVA